MPSMLDLVRLSRRSLFPPGGVELYRQIALLTDLAQDLEVLDVACGPGVCLEYFVTEYGVQGSGVDYDATMVEVAEERAREASLSERMHFQHGSLDALPYRDEIFDVVVGELGLTAQADPSSAVGELVRVTKPGGRVVLVQLVWKAPVEEARRAILSDHLGAHPLMLVEWKRILRESGVENLHTEDWSDEETAFRPQIKKPFPDFSELFSFPEKIGILRRAWGRWGFQGVRTAISREMEVHRVLTRERILGLDLVMGTKAGAAVVPPAEPISPASVAPPLSVPAERSPPSPAEPPLAPPVESSQDPLPGREATGPAPKAPDQRAATEPDSAEGQDDAADVHGLPLFTTRDDA